MNIPPLALLPNFSGPEIFLIFMVVLLLFGAKRLPELFKSFGKSIKEFKKATSGIEDDIRSAMDSDDERPAAPKVDSKSVPSVEEQPTVAAEKPKDQA